MRRLRDWRWPVLVALLCWSTLVWTRAGPGITSDEPFNVLFGIDLVSRSCQRGWGFFAADSINETFATRSEHPPLGRWVIGWTHWVINRVASPNEFGERDIIDSRIAPATAFALMLAVLIRRVSARFGELGGISAGLSLILMPRVFGHAHLAALDTFVAVTFFLGVLAAGWMMEGGRSWLRASLAGIGLGCALLTKMHGVFLFPLVGCWAVWRFGFRSVLPLLVWSVVGIVVFYLGWQWLWGDLQRFWDMVWAGQLSEDSWIGMRPHVFARSTAYLGSAVARSPTFVTYLGRSYRDMDVPWHYPWLLFAFTVPLGIHVFALCGVVDHLRAGRHNQWGWLQLGAWLMPLLVFSLPAVPVYDGVRLFLMVFPFWAAFAGQGAAWVAKRLGEWGRPWWGATLVIVTVVFQSFGLWHYYPCHLSYYNLLVGGLRGAAALGMEVTYWGDSITPQFLDQWAALAPNRSCAGLVPTLYEGQEALYDSPGMRRRGLSIHSARDKRCRYLILYNRRAYLGEYRGLVDDHAQPPLTELAVDGVWLSRVYGRPSITVAFGEEAAKGAAIDYGPVLQSF